MKRIIFLLIFAIALLGCVEKPDYIDPIAPIYVFENFEKAIEANDLDSAWDMLSPAFKESRFGNSADAFKQWAVKGNPEFDALFEGSTVSEIVVVQNVEMVLRKTNGDIRSVKEGDDWKIDSLLIPSD